MAALATSLPMPNRKEKVESISEYLAQTSEVSRGNVELRALNENCELRKELSDELDKVQQILEEMVEQRAVARFAEWTRKILAR